MFYITDISHLQVGNFTLNANDKVDPEGGRGSGPRLKNHKNIGLPSNIGLDPLNSQSYQASIECWAIIGTPAKRWRAYDGPLIFVRSSLPS